MERYFIAVDYTNVLIKKAYISKIYNPLVDNWESNYLISRFIEGKLRVIEINEYQALNFKDELRRKAIYKLSLFS